MERVALLTVLSHVRSTLHVPATWLQLPSAPAAPFFVLCMQPCWLCSFWEHGHDMLSGGALGL